MIALVIVGNGRLDYLERTMQSVWKAQCSWPQIMVDDSGDPDVTMHLHEEYPNCFHVTHTENRGMAAAVQSGWGMALYLGADHIIHLEDDMELQAAPPIAAAIDALDANSHVAQMLFQRQPLTPAEHASGSVLGAMEVVADHGDWSEQTSIFSLNPCVIPRRVLELGWPSGPLGVGNETGMTNKLRARGYTFGVWHGQYVEHIGETRGKAWQL